jgi:hypothetical protein
MNVVTAVTASALVHHLRDVADDGRRRMGDGPDRQLVLASGSGYNDPLGAARG